MSYYKAKILNSNTVLAAVRKYSINANCIKTQNDTTRNEMNYAALQMVAK